jgi:hypothetical protein
MHHLTRFLGAAAIGVCLAACTDATGPGAIRAPGGMRELKAHTSGTDATAAGTSGTDTSAVPDTSATPLRFLPWAPPLQTYDTVFTIVQGRASADTIYFRPGPLNRLRLPFMVLTTPRTAQFVDSTGTPLRQGSTVRLTVHVDSVYMQLNFGPHGSSFTKTPAKLQVFWLFTDLLGHPGSGLDLWYQPDATTAWSALPTTIDLQNCWLLSDLYHFSNYRVAF